MFKQYYQINVFIFQIGAEGTYSTDFMGDQHFLPAERPLLPHHALDESQ